MPLSLHPLASAPLAGVLASTSTPVVTSSVLAPMLGGYPLATIPLMGNEATSGGSGEVGGIVTGTGSISLGSLEAEGLAEVLTGVIFPLNAQVWSEHSIYDVSTPKTYAGTSIASSFQFENIGLSGTFRANPLTHRVYLSDFFSLRAAQTPNVHLVTTTLNQAFYLDDGAIFIAPCYMADFVELSSVLSVIATRQAKAEELLELLASVTNYSKWFLSLEQSFELTDQIFLIVSALSQELFNLTDSLVAIIGRANALVESLGLSSKLSASLQTTAHIKDALTLGELLVFLFTLSLTEQVDLSPEARLDALRSAYLEDAVGFSARFSGFISTTLNLLTGVSLHDVADFDFRYILSALEALQFEDVTLPSFLCWCAANELLNLTDSTTFSFVIFTQARDNLSLHTSTNASFFGLLSATESLGFTTHLKLLDGDYSAWILNADSLGVSQYSNFPFNSLAAHKGRYLGVTETGLYELTGNTDDGEFIESMIRTGDMDFGTRQHKTLVRAYLYLTSSDDIILKTISTHRGTRNETWYQINARLTADDSQTRRVRLGKGLRGTTWALELTNVDGGDFDLRYAEVLPVVLYRRV